MLLGLSIYLFLQGLRKTATEKVLNRLAAGQPQLVVEQTRWVGLERMFLRAGLGRLSERLGQWLSLWAAAMAAGFLTASWGGLVLMLIAPPVALRLSSPSATADGSAA
jgi:tight adherence protein B